LDDRAVPEVNHYFDLSPTDRSLAILDETSPVTFHAVWDLVGPVDFEALAWAWQALARLHPILSCRTNVALDSMWQPGSDLAPIQVETGITDFDLATSREPLAHLNPIDGPVVRLTATTRADGYRMVMAAHHAALDGAASVELIDDLRRLYLARCAGHPEPSTTDSPRTIQAALQQRRLSVAVVQGLLTQSLDRWRKLPPSNHVDPSSGAVPEANGHVTIDLGPALESLDEKRRRNSWPMDAVLVGLLERSWNEVFGSNGEGAGVWLVSADLRASLGLMGGIGNLGGVEAVAVSQAGAKTLDRLIEEAAAEIAVTRSGFPGLGPELMARSWAWMPPPVMNQGVEAMIRAGRRRRYTRILSNLGRIRDSLSDWGPVRLVGLRYLGPMTRGPYCLFVVMTFAGSSSLTVRTAPGWLTDEHARQLESAINRSC
jgi:hypothetical protein